MASSGYIHLFALEEQYLKKKKNQQKNVIQAVKNKKTQIWPKKKKKNH